MTICLHISLFSLSFAECFQGSFVQQINVAVCDEYKNILFFEWKQGFSINLCDSDVLSNINKKN